MSECGFQALWQPMALVFRGETAYIFAYECEYTNLPNAGER